ncbi:MAG: DsrE family protein [Pseudomonadota bacterium]|nr:DsrE family protein [Pseudomonadota bacterium]
MTPASRRSFVLGTAALFVAALPLAALADEKSKNKVVFQVSDSDPVKWNVALNNIKNLQVDLQDDVDIELVVYGPGMPMLKADSSVGKRIAETLKTGAKVVACENTMRGMKLVYADMLPDIGYVPAGVVEVMRKQQQGYAYIRP